MKPGKPYGKSIDELLKEDNAKYQNQGAIEEDYNNRSFQGKKGKKDYLIK